jgi:peptidoglycan/xylan/chitin deacetylase (PgdA/CDA1 family)
VVGWVAGTVWFQPRYAVRGLERLNPDVLFQVATDRKLVAITVDDGPHPEITPRVLDLLRERDVRLTFFVMGTSIAGNEAILERMRAEGHELANHLVEDRPAVLMAEDEFTRQLLAVDPWLDPASGFKWMRPGSGWFTSAMVDRVAEHGYRLVLGSIFPHDDVIHDPEVLSRDVLARIHPGAIVILHDGADERATLPETLGLILDGLAERGYRAVTVTELVRAGG